MTTDSPTGRVDPTEVRPLLTVAVVTYERPDFLRRCLAALVEQGADVHQVVVVDASAVDQSADVARLAPHARYIHAPHLAGWMTRSRNEALRWVSGDLVTFIDDDVVVRPGWAARVRDAFADPTVAAVAGRTCNGVAGEESYDRPVGRLLSDGTLTEGFASDPGAPVDVDHGIGANMTFRRAVLADLGGFRDDYPGTALREDTDMFLRVKAIGGRSVFDPAAVVDHRPAPHVRGARFDTRYKIYGRRNHVVLLARATGSGSAVLRRWIAGEFRRVMEPSRWSERALRLGVTTIGIAWGLAALPRQARWRPMPPRRTDRMADMIRSALDPGAMT